MIQVTSSLLVALATVASATPVQWSASVGGNNHWYELVVVPEGIQWGDARVAAEARGGYLATITSAAENEFVHQATGVATTAAAWRDNFYQSQWYGWGPWLGGFQPNGSQEPGGNWQWVTGEAFTFSAWEVDQPDEFGGENALHFFSIGLNSQGSTWNDLGEIQAIRGYVVEYVPAPSALCVLGLAGVMACQRRR